MNEINLIYNENLIQSKLYPLNSPKRITIKDNSFVPSAVLFPIIPYEKKPYDLIIIHRTDRGSKHRGEMSFPGGKFDPNVDKTLQDTALRETNEEIGVSVDKIKLLGCLHDFPTMTRYIITAFIGIIDKDQKLVKEDREVQEILKIPIDFFVNKTSFREQMFEADKKKFPVFYFNYKNNETNKKYTIWGATAYMISTFIEIIYNYKMSEFEIRRFSVEEIKALKNYVALKDKITKNFKD